MIDGGVGGTDREKKTEREEELIEIRGVTEREEDRGRKRI